MRILHILDHSIPLQSGYTFRTRNILRQQRALGWETSHVTGLKHKGATSAVEEVDGLRFYRTADTGSLLNRLPVVNQMQVVRTLAQRVSEVVALEKPDILHAHSPALNGLAALRVGRELDFPVVYECRAFWEDAAVDHGTSIEGGLRYRLTRALESRVFRGAAGVTTICEGLRKDIVARGIAADKVTVIPNAVDIEGFTVGSQPSLALAESLGLMGRTVLGFIGSFYAYEGISLLLEALPLIKRECPNLALLLVGGGPEEQALKQQLKQLGLEDDVVMTGRVPHSDVQSYYDLIDVLVYPRLSMRLTDLVTPLKPLEAMAQGRVLVASNVGGHRELIEDRKTGYLFKAGDVNSLAETVLEMISARSEWSDLRQRGREFVELERNWATSVARYEKLYKGLLV